MEKKNLRDTVQEAIEACDSLIEQNQEWYYNNQKRNRKKIREAARSTLSFVGEFSEGPLNNVIKGIRGMKENAESILTELDKNSNQEDTEYIQKRLNRILDSLARLGSPISEEKSRSDDTINSLIGSFSQFITEKEELQASDWNAACAEYNVKDLFSGKPYKDWHFQNPELTQTTLNFLERVNEKEGKDITLGLMKRLYNKVEVTEEDREKYPKLEILDSDDLTPEDFELVGLIGEEKKFLDLHEVPGNFYPSVVEQINRSYRFKIYHGAVILSRKLVENLVVDVLRNHYPEDRDKYYEGNGKFRNFGELIRVFEKIIDEYEHVSGSLNQSFIQKLHDFRHRANPSAHSVEEKLEETDMEKMSTNTEKLAKVLIKLKKHQKI